MRIMPGVISCMRLAKPPCLCQFGSGHSAADNLPQPIVLGLLRIQLRDTAASEGTLEFLYHAHSGRRARSPAVCCTGRRPDTAGGWARACEGGTSAQRKGRGCCRPAPDFTMSGIKHGRSGSDD